jgi:hypothetical protein
MTTTKKEIIDAAYEEIGLAGYVFDITPDEYTGALNRLNRFGAELDAMGVRFGYQIPTTAQASTINDPSGIPDWAEEGVITNLAVRLARTIGRQIAPDLAKRARESYKVLTLGTVDLNQMQMPRTMPIGMGNRRNTKNQQFFAPVDRLQGKNDSFLDPDGNPWQDSN